MTPIPFKKLALEDLTTPEGDLDLPRLVEALNNFMVPVYDQLKRGVVVGQQKVVPLKTRSTVEDVFPFLLQTGLRQPRKAVVIDAKDITNGATLITGVYPDVEPTADGRLQVNFLSGLQPNTRYEITFLVLE